ncbi:MAG TPA: DUF6687 family protein [Pyrinomonadaceae bacterium]|nr:DUF6687 family protein [Pyrinomonadaceae bacterium]
MRFEFYHSGLDSVAKISVDGTVPNSIHLSHWQGNKTPAEVKADTSTEIALNVVASPRRAEITQGVKLVTNNHFDTDGVLSVWTMLNDERSLEFRDKLIAAAEAGDFSELSTADAVRASITIQGSDQPVTTDESGSPLARKIAGSQVDDDGGAYELVLPEVEHVLTRIGDYEDLWRGPWRVIEKTVDSFEKQQSDVEEFTDAKISLVTLSDQVYGGHFDPSLDGIPFTAVSRYATGELFIIGVPYQGGWAYRIDYPYYSWAETTVRPRINRRNLSAAMLQLNQLESSGHGKWVADSAELSSAAKFLSDDGRLASSTISPGKVAESIIANSTRADAARSG